MSSLLPYDMAKSLQVKTENDLPQHITYDQFKTVYDNLTNLDQILWGLLWETGGRITAVLSIRWIDIDLNAKEIKLLVQKKKRHTTIRIPLSNVVLSLIRNYMALAKPDVETYIFSSKSKVGRLTRQAISNKLVEIGRTQLGFSGKVLRSKDKIVKGRIVSNVKRDDLHPHMLRHGLAIYLLSRGVPLQVIAARLGHSNLFITQKSYLVITPEIQRQLTAHIPMG